MEAGERKVRLQRTICRSSGNALASLKYLTTRATSGGVELLVAGRRRKSSERKTTRANRSAMYGSNTKKGT